MAGERSWPADPAPDGDHDPGRLVCVDDFHQVARARLDPQAYEYYRSGALREWTLRENERAFTRWRFVRRSLVDVSSVVTATTVLGADVALPVLVAPTAFHRLADPEGEVATARAARAAGTVMVTSTLATMPLEDVAATGAMRWFQLYVFRDRGLTRELVDRAMAAGYTAIVPTVDTPTIGIRYPDQRNRFELPAGMELANVAATLSTAGVSDSGVAPGNAVSGLRAFSDQFDQSLSWRDLEWLCSLCPVPVIPKGVVTANDALQAVASGAAGVVVSNHGGRQLDGDPATLDALPEVVDAIGGSATVLMDGGIRNGTDVVKAVALGADAVLVGRPVLWALAAGGQGGVERLFQLFADEVADTLRQLGVPRLDDLDAGVVRPVD